MITVFTWRRAAVVAPAACVLDADRAASELAERGVFWASPHIYVHILSLCAQGSHCHDWLALHDCLDTKDATVPWPRGRRGTNPQWIPSKAAETHRIAGLHVLRRRRRDPRAAVDCVAVPSRRGAEFAEVH